ncbi:hypothetical protein IP69_19575, partial [Bosea sp. AAP35]|uniref:hypothetical protein n=1 Tax=Bosea sp. AAP35 TaxID=1523417 RepID=UPI0006CE02F2
ASQRPFAKGRCDASTRNRLKGNRHGGQFYMTKRGQFRMSLDSVEHVCEAPSPRHGRVAGESRYRDVAGSHRHAARKNPVKIETASLH